MDDKEKKYPEGHFVGMWIGIGIAIFTGMGVPLSIALGNPGLMGIGPAIGVAFGAAIGASIEAKHKAAGKIRPLTTKERSNRKNLIYVGLAVLIILAGALLFAFLF